MQYSSVMTLNVYSKLKPRKEDNISTLGDRIRSERKQANDQLVAEYCEARMAAGPCITGIPGMVGDMVFLAFDGEDSSRSKPHWIAEWQPDNGEVFAIVDAHGNVTLAEPLELTRDWRGVVADYKGLAPATQEETLEEYADD